MCCASSLGSRCRCSWWACTNARTTTGAAASRSTAITEDDAEGQLVITFNTKDGHTVTVPPPNRINPGVLDPGETMAIRYLRSNPTNVISNESHFSVRDFTLWFVVVKLLFGAAV